MVGRERERAGERSSGDDVSRVGTLGSCPLSRPAQSLALGVDHGALLGVAAVLLLAAHRLLGTFKTVMLEVVVPEFPPVVRSMQDVTGDYNTLIAQREMARLKAAEDADDRAWEMATQRQKESMTPEDEPKRVTATPEESPETSAELANLIGAGTRKKKE